jgi:hypothetical protein
MGAKKIGAGNQKALSIQFSVIRFTFTGLKKAEAFH